MSGSWGPQEGSTGHAALPEVRQRKNPISGGHARSSLSHLPLLTGAFLAPKGEHNLRFPSVVMTLQVFPSSWVLVPE